MCLCGARAPFHSRPASSEIELATSEPGKDSQLIINPNTDQKHSNYKYRLSHFSPYNIIFIIVPGSAHVCLLY